MKQKIFTTLLIIVSGALCFSCLNDDDDSIDLTGGYLMFISGNTQNEITLDPFRVAFRLNSYLETKDLLEQQLTPTNRDSIQQAIESAKSELLGKTVEIDETDPGSIRISFNDTSNAQSFDQVYLRTGTLVISTGGRSLGELEQDYTWTISMDSGDIFNIRYNTTTYNYQLNTPVIIYAAADEADTGGHAWRYHASAFVAWPTPTNPASMPIRSSWDYTFTFKQNSGNQTLEELKKSTLSASAEASGRPMQTEYLLKYETLSDIKYVISCNGIPPFKAGGTERFEIRDMSVVDRELYPEAVSRVSWVLYESCSSRCILQYNGYETYI